MDLAAAIQTMAIAAVDVGLHTSWLVGFRESVVRPIIGIPDDVPVLGLLGLGYPDGLANLPERRPREEVIAWDRWQTDRARTSLP
jgi:nitroreductase